MAKRGSCQKHPFLALFLDRQNPQIIGGDPWSYLGISPIPPNVLKKGVILVVANSWKSTKNMFFETSGDIRTPRDSWSDTLFEWVFPLWPLSISILGMDIWVVLRRVKKEVQKVTKNGHFWTILGTLFEWVFPLWPLSISIPASDIWVVVRRVKKGVQKVTQKGSFWTPKMVQKWAHFGAHFWRQIRGIWALKWCKKRVQNDPQNGPKKGPKSDPKRSLFDHLLEGSGHYLKGVHILH